MPDPPDVAVRSSLIVLYEAPWHGDWKPGLCRWCGDPITLTDPGDYRRRGRTVHRGDEHEVGDSRCRLARARSVVWNARDAVRYLAQDQAVLVCVDCGVVVEHVEDPQEGWTPAPGAPPWQADHQVPLEDGGTHTLDNFRCRCVPCHARKTGGENSTRAAARRPRQPAQQLAIEVS